jgi:hypothetical protein
MEDPIPPPHDIERSEQHLIFPLEQRRCRGCARGDAGKNAPGKGWWVSSMGDGAMPDCQNLLRMAREEHSMETTLDKLGRIGIPKLLLKDGILVLTGEVGGDVEEALRRDRDERSRKLMGS